MLREWTSLFFSPPQKVCYSDQRDLILQTFLPNLLLFFYRQYLEDKSVVALSALLGGAV